MPKKMSNKWVSLCSVAIGAVYTVGFFHSESSAKASTSQSLSPKKMAESVSNKNQNQSSNGITAKKTNTNPPTTQSESLIVSLNSGSLNVRQAPNTQSSIIGELRDGGKVTVTKKQSNWDYITYDGIKGWTDSKYLVNQSQYDAIQTKKTADSSALSSSSKNSTSTSSTSTASSRSKASSSTSTSSTASNSHAQPSKPSTTNNNTVTVTVKPKTTTQTTTVKTQAPKPTLVYKNGTFSGTGSNRIGSVSVSLTLSNDKITQVEIVNCATHYPEYLIQNLPNEVVQRQSANVDTISGATLSSEDFMSAVQSALESAKN